MAGVVAFFLVSGYVIPFSLERLGRLDKFWIGRGFRLFPLYLTVVLTVTLLVGLGAPYSHRAKVDLTSLPVWMTNLTMTQEWFARPSIIGLAWTLSYEMAFYISCSLLFALGLLRHTAWAVLLVTAVLSFFTAPWKYYSQAGFQYMWLYGGTFFVGTLLYRKTCGGERHRLTDLALTVWLFLVGFVALRSITTTTATSVAVLLGYAIFLAALALRECSFPPFFGVLGAASYSIYMIHGAILAVTDGWEPLPRTLIVLGGTALLTPLTMRFIEKPGVALGKRLVQGHLKPAVMG